MAEKYPPEFIALAETEMARTGKSKPKTKTKTITPLIDPALEIAIRKYHAAKASRLSLEKAEKQLKSEVAEGIAKYRDEFPDTWFSFNGAEVHPSDRPGSPRVSADKLLERGVDPEIIAFATSATPFTQYDTNIEEA